MLTGLGPAQSAMLGEPEVCVAVLDGPVDLSHPCFAGANIRRLDTLVQDPAGQGRMSVHGTHVASLIFGQPGSPVVGIAPGCKGLIVPVFREFEEGRLSQLDLARAIEQSVLEGAHVINISGGERSQDGQPDPLLKRALQLCDENNVLVVAAAGNDGCACLHVPAAVPSVLPVGALGRNGEPLESSNWGEGYRSHGVLAPGEEIMGAVPGGGTLSLTGTSFATPIVSGAAALLLSIQHRAHNRIDPRAAARAILDTAHPCNPRDAPECGRYLAGILDVPRAYAYNESEGKTAMTDLAATQIPSQAVEVASGQTSLSAAGTPEGGVRAASAGLPAGAAAAESVLETADAGVMTSAVPAVAGGSAESVLETADAGVMTSAVPAVAGGSGAPSADRNGKGVTSSGDCNCQGTAAATVGAAVTPSYVYALGTVSFDFGTEARRDTFRQSMPEVERRENDTIVLVSPNPYDVFQLSDYLNSRPSESTKLIWTLNLDLTPIYALEAEVAYPEDVYGTLRGALRREALPSDNPNFVSRLSIPGVMTNRTVRLFSGQVVPVVMVQPRGLFEWAEPSLVKSVVDTLRPGHEDMDEDRLSRLVRIFLDKVYFQCRNLGRSSADRALNFAATNAFQFASGILNGILSGKLVPGGDDSLYALDSITVKQSPYCRMDSDCQDVLITWFDPENERRARSVFQFTIDVSDELPVSLAPAHQYLTT